MPAPTSSLIHGNTVVVRVRRPGAQVSRRRYVGHHGPHGSLLELPLHVALRLLEEGSVKLLGDVHRSHLFRACELAARGGAPQ